MASNINKFTDFAFRVLIYLASCEGRQRLQDVAGYFDISHEHLRKVVHALVQSGFVISQRGKNGGITLARPAAEISLGAVLRALEADKKVVDCRGKEPCRFAGHCALESLFDGAREAFYAYLDDRTLDEVSSVLPGPLVLPKG